MDGDGDGDGDRAGEPMRQTDGVDPIGPIGAALRATYDAENHDTLGRDLTGLMLALARVEDPVPAPVVDPAPATAGPRSWRQRLFGR